MPAAGADRRHQAPAPDVGEAAADQDHRVPRWCRVTREKAAMRLAEKRPLGAEELVLELARGRGEQREEERARAQQHQPPRRCDCVRPRSAGPDRAGSRASAGSRGAGGGRRPRGAGRPRPPAKSQRQPPLPVPARGRAAVARPPPEADGHGEHPEGPGPGPGRHLLGRHNADQDEQRPRSGPTARIWVAASHTSEGARAPSDGQAGRPGGAAEDAGAAGPAGRPGPAGPGRETTLPRTTARATPWSDREAPNCEAA